MRRHGVHAAGPVASASAFARRYSAASRSGVPTAAATSRIRFSSVRSRRVAVSDSRRCWATRNATRSPVAASTPIRSRIAAATRSPTGTCPPSPFFPMSWSSAPSASPRRSVTCRAASAWTGSSSAPSPATSLADVRERTEQVRVDRGSVVRIALRSAADVGPLRGRTGSGPSDPVEDLQRRRSAVLAAEQIEERLADLVVPVDLRGARRRPRSRRGGPPTAPGRRPPPRGATAGRWPGSSAASPPWTPPRGIAGRRRAGGTRSGVRARTSRASSRRSRSVAVRPRTPSRERSRAGGRARAGRSASRSRGGGRSGRGSGTPPRPRALRARGRGGVPPHPGCSRSRPRAARSNGGPASRPSPSFSSGSRSCAAEPKRSRRRAASSRRAVANARGSARAHAETRPEASATRPSVARDPAHVQHRGRRVEPIARPLAVLHRPDGVADLEPRVPERIQERVRQRRHPWLVRRIVQEENVDVGARKQEPPPEAADRGHRRAGRRAGAREQLPDRSVHEVRAPARRPYPVVARRVRALEGAVLGAELLDGIGHDGHGA